MCICGHIKLSYGIFTYARNPAMFHARQHSLADRIRMHDVRSVISIPNFSLIGWTTQQFRKDEKKWNWGRNFTNAIERKILYTDGWLKWPLSRRGVRPLPCRRRTGLQGLHWGKLLPAQDTSQRLIIVTSWEHEINSWWENHTIEMILWSMILIVPNTTWSNVSKLCCIPANLKVFLG